MISFLNGTLAGKTADTAYIEVNGVGFAVGMSGNALAKLPAVGKPVKVFTYMQVRDDALALFGFLTQDEKALFEKLIGVSGVGPKMALSALSSFTPNDLARAVTDQDTAMVSRIPGVGKKTAQRIILELKGSFDAQAEELAANTGATQSQIVRSVADALLGMGFTSAEADLALKDAPSQGNEAVLLQYALKRLGEQRG